MLPESTFLELIKTYETKINDTLKSISKLEREIEKLEYYKKTLNKKRNDFLEVYNKEYKK